MTTAPTLWDWKKLPIPDVPAEQQAPIVLLVDKVLDAKRADLTADVWALEREIDELVAWLYGLTVEEIAIVGGQ
jgi:adenine-specific DNA-methyltransferase